MLTLILVKMHYNVNIHVNCVFHYSSISIVVLSNIEGTMWVSVHISADLLFFYNIKWIHKPLMSGARPASKQRTRTATLHPATISRTRRTAIQTTTLCCPQHLGGRICGCLPCFPTHQLHTEPNPRYTTSRTQADNTPYGQLRGDHNG